MEELALDGARGSAVQLADEPGKTVIGLVGEIDISNAEPIGSAIEAIVRDSSAPIVFDLGDLRFMDSSGIALLLRFSSSSDGGAELRRVAPVIRRVVEATGLSEVLRIVS